jgi:hypothetical protein
MEVRPEHSGPTSSLIAPTGSPPCNTPSSAVIPVSTTGRRILGAGVSAEGILCASADSIWNRIIEAEVMASSSPYIRLYCLSIVK